MGERPKSSSGLWICGWVPSTAPAASCQDGLMAAGIPRLRIAALFYFRRNSSLWRVPVEGGEESQVIESLKGGYEVVEDGIYFISVLTPGAGASIQFLRFATGAVEHVFSLERWPPMGLSVSPTADRSCTARWTNWKPTSCWWRISGEGFGVRGGIHLLGPHTTSCGLSAHSLPRADCKALDRLVSRSEAGGRTGARVPGNVGG